MSAKDVVTIGKLHSLAITATKIELHEKLLELDRDYIQKCAHIRNSLTSTEPSQEIIKELNKRTRSSKSHLEVSLEELSIHSDAFERIIKCSGVYSPLLQRIKDSHDKYVLLQLGREKSDTYSQQATFTELPIMESVKLRLLKRRVSKLESNYQIAMQESTRLKSILFNDKQAHAKVMESPLAPITVEQDVNMLPDTYNCKVEGLQLQIVLEQEAIQDAMARREGKVPISVCYQLEQCVREVELEIQKLQKQCETLEVMVKETESRLATAVTAANVAPEILRKLWQGLQENTSSEI